MVTSRTDRGGFASRDESCFLGSQSQRWKQRSVSPLSRWRWESRHRVGGLARVCSAIADVQEGRCASSQHELPARFGVPGDAGDSPKRSFPSHRGRASFLGCRQCRVRMEEYANQVAHRQRSTGTKKRQRRKGRMLMTDMVCPVCGSQHYTRSASIAGSDGRVYGLRRCRECGLRSLLNAPDQDVLSAHYGAGYYSQETLRNPSILFRVKQRLEQSERPMGGSALAVPVHWAPAARARRAAANVGHWMRGWCSNDAGHRLGLGSRGVRD